MMTSLAQSADSPKRDMQQLKDSTATRLRQLHQRLLRRQEEPMPSTPPDPNKLAGELELLGAKAATLANEIRHAEVAGDAELMHRTMGYLHECYRALSDVVERPERSQWSRA